MTLLGTIALFALTMLPTISAQQSRPQGEPVPLPETKASEAVKKPVTHQDWLFTQTVDGAERMSIRAREISRQNGVVFLKNIQITRGDIVIRADEASFNAAAGEIRPQGNVIITIGRAGK